MFKPKNLYLLVVFIHLLLGGVIFFIPFLAKIYSLIIIIVGYGYVIKNKNRNNEVLVVCSYIVGVEVFLRMTSGMYINEFGKYNIILLMLLGIIYRGIHKGAYIYVVFIVLLIPGIFYGIHTLSLDANIRKAIAFNISGPVCLGFSAIYCFKRRVTLQQMKHVFIAFGMPILCIVTYLFLYAPDIRSVVTGTQSNHDLSGGFGPNQMSTILGFGMFVFFVIFYLYSKTKRDKIITLLLLIIITFRGIITFSRGGIYAGLGMIILLIIYSYFKINIKAKLRVLIMSITFIVIGSGIWLYSSLSTGGLIEKRYSNQDAKGREKESKLSGRESLIESEFAMFLDNPITGVGVGKNKEYRLETTGIEAASHNEISRMLAEHGMLGVICLLLLLTTPLFMYINNKNNIFLLSFYIFWLLTINHAAMRLAIPAFIYALSLLDISFIDQNQKKRE